MKDRVPELDGLRGVAILMVLVWHYFVCLVRPDPGTFLAHLKRALHFCWSGVDLFFVLSGFLIMGILIDNRESPHYFKVFYIRRMCRIFPLYFAVVFSFVLVGMTSIGHSRSFESLFSGPVPLWSYLTFTQNIVMGMKGGYGAEWLSVTWSLAIEEQFYLFLPFMVYSVTRKRLVIVLLTVLLTAPLLRAASQGLYAFINLPWRADSLLTGAFLALLVRSNEFMRLARDNRGAVRALFMVMLAGILVMMYRGPAFGVFNHLWLAGVYAVSILLVLLKEDQWLSRVARTRSLRRLGVISYGVYMLHVPVSGLLYGLVRQSVPALHGWTDGTVTLLAILVTLSLANLSYCFMEKPVLDFGRTYTYGCGVKGGSHAIPPTS
jgi:peptidoglycan/LPS O-acetylase OafA/YrhL